MRSRFSLQSAGLSPHRAQPVLGALLAHPRAWLARAAALLPGSCALCGATGPHALCRGCRAEHFSGSESRCIGCALPMSMHESDPSRQTCGACLTAPPAFDASVAAVNYAAPVDQLVLGLKFGGRLALAPLFADLIGAALVRHGAAGETPNVASASRQLPELPELLMPVPLGPLRLQERGFNQALEIARPLALATGIPLAPRLLMRVRDTAAQSKLSPSARHQNLQQAFLPSAGMAERLRGKHVGVVDDVMTTGATLEAVADTLKRFGAARVTNLVFARTLPR